jgi:nucleoside-diphosphate-sugar epimerase
VVQELTNPLPRSRRVLVTGATGFVGTVLCRALAEHGIPVRRAVRGPGATAPDGNDVVIGDIDAHTDWGPALRDVDAVIHLAARTHVMRDSAPDPHAEYRRVNLLATKALAQAAASGGVRRFIFISSVKVNGENTGAQPFTERDVPAPEDNYGRSKWETEQALCEIAGRSKLETVVLRPPLLYGPGVKGNFLSLMRTIDHGLPLPLASIRNQRSLLYVGNLVDAIILCLDLPAAAGKTYLLADDKSISTPDMVRAIAAALGKPARLMPMSPVLLRLAGLMFNRSAAISRLLGSLQIDSSKIRGELGWQPRSDLHYGLSKTVEWYREKLTGDAQSGTRD